MMDVKAVTRRANERRVAVATSSCCGEAWSLLRIGHSRASLQHGAFRSLPDSTTTVPFESALNVRPAPSRLHIHRNCRYCPALAGQLMCRDATGLARWGVPVPAAFDPPCPADFLHLPLGQQLHRVHSMLPNMFTNSRYKMRAPILCKHTHHDITAAMRCPPVHPNTPNPRGELRLGLIASPASSPPNHSPMCPV